MTKSAKLLFAGLATGLLAVIVVLSIFLVQSQREATRYRAGEQQRRDFCLAYAGMLDAVRSGMEAARTTSKDQTQAWVFVWLTNPAFLKVCHVAEPTQSKIADRASWGCTRGRTDGIGSEYDLQCLQSLARELERAIPLSQ